MTKLLIPGLTCAEVFAPDESGVLVDGRDFYRAVYDACRAAEKTILMSGWQFASKVHLMRGKDAEACEHPVRFVDFLRELCEQKPELEIFILAWDASPIFAFEREPLQRLMFQVKGHKRIHYKMDNAHPAGASHHQKLVITDRAVAFLGGMDICNARWDDRCHEASSQTRCAGEKPYAPYHDVQAYVTGEPVDVLRDWFCTRWQRATGKDLKLPDVDRAHVKIEPTFPIDAPSLGLTRTLPRMEEPATTAKVTELYELHLRAIAHAEHSIYLENQYLSSDEIERALEERMRRGGPPLEIVVVLPEKSSGFKERISIGVYQARILARWVKVAAECGHHLGIYYTVACGEQGEDVPVFIHAKVLAVDDRFLLVSSANTTNRSMGFDTELGVAWEAPEENDSIRNGRLELLAEHVGLERAEAEQLLAPIPGLVERLDSIAEARSHRLRIHRRNQDEKPGWLLSKLLPKETPFDPDNPRDMEEMMPEPGAWLDRIFRDPYVMLSSLGRRMKSRFNPKRLKA
jgi:phospholipase D1/2